MYKLFALLTLINAGSCHFPILTSNRPDFLNDQNKLNLLGLKWPFFRTCKNESADPIKTMITGIVPKWLNGTLLRVGAGIKQIGPDRYRHSFDGLSLLHRSKISNGEVEYQNKFLISDVYNRSINANRIVVTDFGTKGNPEFSKWTDQELRDNDCINIIPINNKYYAVTETTSIRRIDTNTLATNEKVDLAKCLGLDFMTAHPHWDDKYVYNAGANFKTGHYHLIKIPNTDKPFENSSIVCSIKMERPLNPSYFHSFSMTDNYLVFMEMPNLISIPQLVSGLPPIDTYHWDPNLKTRFYVIQKKDGKVLDTKYISEPFFCYHTINAFEDNNQIVVDLLSYPNDTLTSALRDERILPVISKEKTFDTYNEIQRFVLPLMDHFSNVHPNTNMVNLNYSKATAITNSNDSSVEIKSEVLSPKNSHIFYEMPRINLRKYNGKHYRYLYSILFDEYLRAKLIKFDTKTKEQIIWSEDNWKPSEPIFVANPDHLDDEDNGVLLSSVLSELDEREAFLLILDAKTFKEIGRASFRTESAVPASFHGIFV